MTVGKRELVRRIAAKTHRSARDVSVIVTATLEVMREALAQGETIRLKGFGAFPPSRLPITDVPAVAFADPTDAVADWAASLLLENSLPGNPVVNPLLLLDLLPGDPVVDPPPPPGLLPGNPVVDPPPPPGLLPGDPVVDPPPPYPQPGLLPGDTVVDPPPPYPQSAANLPDPDDE